MIIYQMLGRLFQNLNIQLRRRSYRSATMLAVRNRRLDSFSDSFRRILVSAQCASLLAFVAAHGTIKPQHDDAGKEIRHGFSSPIASWQLSGPLRGVALRSW